MFTILGHLAGALGLFFMGASLLTEHLKVLANRRVRLSAARWTGNRCLGFAWGLVTGSVMQSMTVLTLVAVSLLKSDLISPKRAFPILLGGNVGGALLVLIVMLDIKLIALYVLGIAQVVTLVMARDRAVRDRAVRDRAVRDRAAPYRAMATACFGLGLIVFGSIMLKESVVPLAALPWFQESLQWVGNSLVMPLLVGAALVFAVQSPLPVILSGIAMATAGLVTVEQVLMLHYGGCLGSSLSLYLLTLNLTGRARQVAMYQVLHNVVLNAIFVPLLWVEGYLEVPLMAAAIGASGLPMDQALAVFIILAEAFTAFFQLAVLSPVVHWLDCRWPPTETEVLGRPKYIHDRDMEDVEITLTLVDLEQRRLLEMLSRYLDTVRQGKELSELRKVAKELLHRYRRAGRDNRGP